MEVNKLKFSRPRCAKVGDDKFNTLKQSFFYCFNNNTRPKIDVIKAVDEKMIELKKRIRGKYEKNVSV